MPRSRFADVRGVVDDVGVGHAQHVGARSAPACVVDARDHAAGATSKPVARTSRSSRSPISARRCSGPRLTSSTATSRDLLDQHGRHVDRDRSPSTATETIISIEREAGGSRVGVSWRVPAPLYLSSRPRSAARGIAAAVAGLCQVTRTSIWRSVGEAGRRFDSPADVELSAESRRAARRRRPRRRSPRPARPGRRLDVRRPSPDT